MRTFCKESNSEHTYIQLFSMMTWHHLTIQSICVLFSPSVYYLNSQVINSTRTTENTEKLNISFLQRVRVLY